MHSVLYDIHAICNINYIENSYFVGIFKYKVSQKKNLISFTICIFIYIFHSIHFTVCISQYALHSMHFKVCILQYAFYSMHFTVCISQYAF